MKKFIDDILICFPFMLVSTYVFSLVFDVEGEGTMKGWMETLVSTVAVSALGLSAVRGKGNLLRKLATSVIIFGLYYVGVEIVLMTQVNPYFGFLHLMLIPFLLSINKLLVESSFSLKRNRRLEEVTQKSSTIWWTDEDVNSDEEADHQTTSS